MKILMIEDEVSIARPVIRVLQKRNYLVDHALDGEDGLKRAIESEYDCIILDLNLPKINGIELCQKLRESNISSPILMLTARSQIYDKLEGFESGADDYLTKPFDMSELLARINALIKRGNPIKSRTIKIAGIEFNIDKNEVIIDKNVISLSNKECGVLEYLILNKGRTISSEELLEHVWDTNVDLITDTVKTHIKTLRSKLGVKEELIKTIKGKGYIIE